MSQADLNANFCDSVWDLVRSVPRGRVVSYGQIARAIGPADDVDPHSYRREGARWVGAALAKCPSDVPWHRVVNAHGKLSFQAAATQQAALLAQEGVHLAQGTVDMSRFQWPALADQDAPAQHSLF